MELPKGARLAEVFEAAEFAGLPYPVLGAFVNNTVCNLDAELQYNCEVRPCMGDSAPGSHMYHTSLTFLLSYAAHAVFPGRRLVISHSLGHGLFFTFPSLDVVPQTDLDALAAKMAEVVAAAEPIETTVESYQEAVAKLSAAGMVQSVSLLAAHCEPTLSLASLRDYVDLSLFPMVHSASLLGAFELMQYKNGFLLRYPSRDEPTAVASFQDNPALFRVYDEYTRIGKATGMECVGNLNDRIARGGRTLQETVLIEEALHDKKLAAIADRVTPDIKLVLIAGPSSSGKTTTAHKLAIQLRVNGRVPVTISLDNYYADRAHTPRDANGDLDFEHIEALDIQTINEQFSALVAGGTVFPPTFDFVKGLPVPGRKPVSLPENGILIVEGIHGLNPRLSAMVANEHKFKIFISPLTQLNVSDHVRISTTDNRLIRRMVRDYQFRGAAAETTLGMWASVRRGEDLWIIPFQNDADATYNSALSYELSALKVMAVPLLRSIHPTHPLFWQARHLLAFMAPFSTVSARYIPPTSILREFIGGSVYDPHAI
jgi:uridine kinase